MLIDTAINLNSKPKSPHIVKYEGVIADFNCSWVFFLGAINMSRFRRKDGRKKCACGCGKFTKPGNKYIKGHYWNGRSRPNQTGDNNVMRRPEVVAKKSGIYHHMKKPEIAAKTSGDKHYTRKDPKARKAISERLKALGDEHPSKRPKFRKLMREFQLANQNHPWRQPEFAKQQSKRMTKEMLNGKAAYMCSCNKSPSKPQVALFKLVKQIYPATILNYLSLNFSIDIAIPDKNIAIEYDSAWWHDGREVEDVERQKKLENIGWKFLRYKDYIPTINELKTDLKQYEKLKLEE